MGESEVKLASLETKMDILLQRMQEDREDRKEFREQNSRMHKEHYVSDNRQDEVLARLGVWNWITSTVVGALIVAAVAVLSKR